MKRSQSKRSFICGSAQDEESLSNDLISLSNDFEQYMDHDQNEQLISTGNQLLVILDKKGDMERFAYVLLNMAEAYSILGDNNKAIELGTQAMEIYKQTLGENHSSYKIVLNNLACHYADLGDYAKAIELETQLIEIEKQKHEYSEDDPYYTGQLGTLAYYYSHLGDYAKAIELRTQLMEIQKRTRGENDPDYALSLSDLADCYSHLGDYAKAIELESQAMEILKHTRGENHPRYISSLSNLAGYYSSLDDHAKAELESEAKEFWQQFFHPDHATSLSNPDYIHLDRRKRLSCPRLRGVRVVED